MLIILYVGYIDVRIEILYNKYYLMVMYVLWFVFFYYIYIRY